MEEPYLVPIPSRWVLVALPRTSRLRPRAVYAGLALVACGAAALTFLLVGTATPHGTPAQAAVPSGSPTALEFAHKFVGTTNAFAAASGDTARIGNAHCVKASQKHFMCSFSSKRPGFAPECRIMQAVWTPNAASTITVTLGGRSERCASLEDALQSLT
jgi:hypothetical protein